MQIQGSSNAASFFNAVNTKKVSSGNTKPEDSLREKQGEPKKKLASEIVVNSQLLTSLDEERASRKNTSYDEPPGKNRLAIQAYVGVNNIERRENVQQALGVDLFA